MKLQEERLGLDLSFLNLAMSKRESLMCVKLFGRWTVPITVFYTIAKQGVLHLLPEESQSLKQHRVIEYSDLSLNPKHST